MCTFKGNNKNDDILMMMENQSGNSSACVGSSETVENISEENDCRHKLILSEVDELEDVEIIIY